MPFAIPMIWREQLDHVSDCYFCLTNTRGFSQKNKARIVYPNLHSAMRPVMHSAEYPLRINYEMSGHTYVRDKCARRRWHGRPHYVPKQSLTPHLRIIIRSHSNDWMDQSIIVYWPITNTLHKKIAQKCHNKIHN